MKLYRVATFPSLQTTMISHPHLISLFPPIPRLCIRTPRQSPLYQIDNNKHENTPRQNPHNIRRENGSFGRIQERVHIKPLRRLRNIRNSQVTRYSQPKKLQGGNPRIKR